MTRLQLEYQHPPRHRGVAILSPIFLARLKAQTSAIIRLNISMLRGEHHCRKYILSRSSFSILNEVIILSMSI